MRVSHAGQRICSAPPRLLAVVTPRVVSPDLPLTIAPVSAPAVVVAVAGRTCAMVMAGCQVQALSALHRPPPMVLATVVITMSLIDISMACVLLMMEGAADGRSQQERSRAAIVGVGQGTGQGQAQRQRAKCE